MRIPCFITLALLFTASAYADVKCGGTEPFWSLDIKADKTVYTNFDGTKVDFKTSRPQEANGLKPGTVQVYTLQNGKDASHAIIHKQKCSDDMSDKSYPYEIIFMSTAEVLYGCCQ